MLQPRHKIGHAFWTEVEGNETSNPCMKDSLKPFASHLDDYGSILATDLVCRLSTL